jgi:hypothetical protein
MFSYKRVVTSAFKGNPYVRVLAIIEIYDIEIEIGSLGAVETVLKGIFELLLIFGRPIEEPNLQTYPSRPEFFAIR